MIELPLWVWASAAFLIWSGICYLIGFFHGMHHKEVIYVKAEKAKTEVLRSNEK